jgi:hypothetical protein
MHLKVVTIGLTRNVLLVGNVAIKFPTSKNWPLFLHGLLANMQERQYSTTGDPRLCPVLFASRLGFWLVMQRAIPLSDEDWTTFDLAKFRMEAEGYIPVEGKRNSFGKIGEQIVAVDYGS